MRLRTLISSALVTAATAAPLVAVAVASPADAASVGTWGRLAHCESSGRWHVNTGNGYYGGLQISSATWHGYGGGHFARLPSRATKGQQIRVAERIKHRQGWHAWPACSARLGLH